MLSVSVYNPDTCEFETTCPANLGHIMDACDVAEEKAQGIARMAAHHGEFEFHLADSWPVKVSVK